MFEKFRKTESTQEEPYKGEELHKKSNELLESQEQQGQKLGKLIKETFDNPNVPKIKKESFAKKSAHVIEDYGNTAQTALVKTAEIAENTSYPLVRMIHSAIDHASEAGNKTITELGKGIAYVIGEHIKQVGRGTASASKDIGIALVAVVKETLHQVSRGAGQGIGGFFKGIQQGFAGQ